MALDTLLIKDLRTTEDNHRVIGNLEMLGENFEIYYSSDDIKLQANPEAMLTLALVPAMKWRVGIHYESKVSQKFLDGLEAVQSLFLEWKPNYRRSPITGITPTTRPLSTGQRVGLFFSGGLDSFYTLIKNQEIITDLIFVRGYDKSLNEDYTNTSCRFKEIADHFNLGLIEISSNQTVFFDRFAPWQFMFGAALASIGHLLYPHFGQIYIAASRTPEIFKPDGAHPRLDPLWSTEGLEFIHDGTEATRNQKAALVSRSEIAMQNLRVCPAALEGQKNCGRCEKCVRTMLNLRIAGVRDTNDLFDQELRAGRVFWLYGLDNRKQPYIRQMLVGLEKDQSDPELEAMLRRVLRMPKIIPKGVVAWRRLRTRARGRRDVADLHKSKGSRNTPRS